MQCSFLRPYERLHEDSESPRVFLKGNFLDGFGGLSVNVKHVPRAVYARTPVPRALSPRATNHQPWRRGTARADTLWRVGSNDGTRDERRRHLAAVLGAGLMTTIPRASSSLALGNPSLPVNSPCGAAHIRHYRDHGTQPFRYRQRLL
jgi:hypothetical protein